MTVSELQINCFEFGMGARRNNGNDIAVGGGNRVRTFYIHSFSGSGRYYQDQILICDIYLFICLFINLFIYLFCRGGSVVAPVDNSTFSISLA